MFILKVEAFADFDTPYDVNIGAFNDLIRVNYLKDRLNEWVSTFPEVNNDIRISNIFEKDNYKNEFIEICRFALSSAIPMDAILSFTENCFKIFQENRVYLNTDIFSVEEIKVIC